MNEPKLTPEEKFRGSLEEVVAVCERLGPLCNDSVGELLQLAKLGCESEAQTRLLMREMTRDRR